MGCVKSQNLFVKLKACYLCSKKVSFSKIRNIPLFKACKLIIYFIRSISFIPCRSISLMKLAVSLSPSAKKSDFVPHAYYKQTYSDKFIIHTTYTS